MLSWLICVLVDLLDVWSYNAHMTKQQLIKLLEAATFRGTWEEVCRIQKLLDNLDKQAV